MPRQDAGHRPIHERIADFGEVEQTLGDGSRQLQASRCMDCGVPFCHWACPLGNKQPEWQDAVYKIEDEYLKAKAYHEIAESLFKLRRSIDKLEEIVDNDMWPLPKYRELLFIN